MTAESNEFSGTAHVVTQINRLIGDLNLVVPTDTLTPHEVPGADWCFVNREAERQHLTAAHGGAVRVVLVTGLPGVGKSALIQSWVEKDEPAFAGGELYIDFASLRSRVGPGAALGEAIALGLTGLGVPNSSALTTEARTNLFRTHTSTRPVLVVLDDVTEPGQVRGLLPRAKGSMVVATCDRRLSELITSQGAQMITLDPLDDDHALRLLAELGGRAVADADPADLRRLVRRCDGLPLALRVVAARLVADETLSVVDVLAELDAGTSRGPLDDAFDLAYRALPPAVAELYGVLAEFTLDPELATIALGTPAGTALTTLYAANLAEKRPDGRYRLYAATARHARALRPVDPAAFERIARFLLRRARAADEAIMGPRLRYGSAPPEVSAVTREEALDWFSTERDNLLRIVRTGAARGHDALVWQLAETTAVLFLNRRSPHDLIEVCTTGAAAARRDGRPDVEARLRTLASRGHLDLDLPERAKADLDAAFAAVAQVDDRRLLASVWEFRGRYDDYLGDVPAAADAYGRSLAENLAIGEHRGAALARYFLARARHGQGDLAEARSLAESALTAFAGEGEIDRDERMEARVRVTLGAVLFDSGAVAEASSLVTAGVETLDRLGAWHYEVEGLRLLAAIATVSGDRGVADRCLRRAIDLLRASGDDTAADALSRDLD